MIAKGIYLPYEVIKTKGQRRDGTIISIDFSELCPVHQRLGENPYQIFARLYSTCIDEGQAVRGGEKVVQDVVIAPEGNQGDGRNHEDGDEICFQMMSFYLALMLFFIHLYKPSRLWLCYQIHLFRLATA
jgi:hypothetical protein